MQLAPTMMDLTSVLARMDFLVTEKLAKVGKVISQSKFSTKFDQGLDSFATPKEHSSSPRVRDSPFRNQQNFCLWNPESRALESGIQLKESGIPLRIGIQIPLTKTGIKYLESRIHSLESRIQYCLGQFFKLSP